MSEASEFSPSWASPPGDTIRDALDARGMTLNDLTMALGESVEVTDLLAGRLKLSTELASKLEELLGGSSPFWLSRERAYRASLSRIEREQEEWSRHFPLQDMQKFGWISSVENGRSADTLFDFFSVESTSVWRHRYGQLEQVVSFRTSPTFDSDPNAVAAWLRQGEIEASMIETSTWNRDRFVSTFGQIKALTRLRRPDHFLPRLRALCAENGVAVTIVRAPAGCRASGAVRFLSPSKAVIQLSFRHLTDDHFWFSFFHEAGHLVLHGPSRLFIEGIGNVTKEESEANEFARDSLLPPSLQGELRALRPRTFDVLRYASKVGVAPGIIVGQLQHMGIIRQNQLNKLKRRFRWEAHP